MRIEGGDVVLFVFLLKESDIMPAPTVPTRVAPPRHDMSVVLVTGSYDHEIRFWEAWSGICSRTITRTGESGVSIAITIITCCA